MVALVMRPFSSRPCTSTRLASLARPAYRPWLRLPLPAATTLVISPCHCQSAPACHLGQWGRWLGEK